MKNTPKAHRPKSRITKIENITAQKDQLNQNKSKEDELLAIKKQSLKKIGIDLKEGNRVSEHDEKSQDSPSPSPDQRKA